MALYSTQVIIHTTDGLPENFCTNTWHADCDDVAAVLLWHEELIDFYEQIGTNLSSLIDNANTDPHEINSYRLSDPAPRTIVASTNFSLPGVGTTALPTEVAVCCSFQAQQISGLPQARRRNRVYVGPMSQIATDSNGRVATNCQTAIRNQGSALKSASDAATSWTWAIYSPTDGTGADVDNGWVDNEFDTQRRRGRQATDRATF